MGGTARTRALVRALDSTVCVFLAFWRVFLIDILAKGSLGGRSLASKGGLLLHCSIAVYTPRVATVLAGSTC